MGGRAHVRVTRRAAAGRLAGFSCVSVGLRATLTSVATESAPAERAVLLRSLQLSCSRPVPAPAGATSSCCRTCWNAMRSSMASGYQMHDRDVSRKMPLPQSF